MNKIVPLRHNFRDIQLEKVYEAIEINAAKTSLRILEQVQLDSTFHHQRGYREALLNIMELIVELDGIEEVEV